MKAFLLAAGLGTRLRPVTETTPKCLVPVNGRPLLSIWLTLLERHGITDVLINTHHLPEAVETFVAQETERSIRIHTAFEKDLLGSAGTVWKNRSFVKGEETFLILYADNLTDCDLTSLAAAHKQNRQKGAPLTMALFAAPNPQACGIASVDASLRITGFAEKPAMPDGNLANAGIYAAGPELFPFIEKGAATKPPYDFGHGVLPDLVSRMYGWKLNGYLRDIGTHAALAAARAEWA